MHIPDHTPVYRQDITTGVVLSIDNILNEVVDVDMFTSKQYRIVLGNCKRNTNRIEYELEHKPMSDTVYTEKQQRLLDIKDIQDLIEIHYAEYLI